MKYYSTAGTFDTGLAQLDQRGSIRRGDIELPIVDEPSVRQNSTNISHNDSGIYSQSPASKERSSSIDKGLSGLVESRELPEKVADEDSPRYVDHNKLFPEAPNDRVGNRETRVNGAFDDGGLQIQKRKGVRNGAGRDSQKHTPHNTERGLKAAGNGREGRTSPKHTANYERTSSNHDRSNKAESGQGEKDTTPGSKPPDRGQEVGSQRGHGCLTTPTSTPCLDSTKPASSDVNDNDQQAAKNTALARLKAKGGLNEKISNSTAEKLLKSTPDVGKEQHSPSGHHQQQKGLRQHQSKQTPQQRHQQQENKQIPLTAEKSVSKSQPEEKPDNTIKALTSNKGPSAGPIHTQEEPQQQKRQKLITDTDRWSPRPSNKEDSIDKTLTSDASPSAESNHFRQASLDQTPLVQPNPFLSSTHEVSSPLQGHLQTSPAKSKGSSSLSEKADVPKGKEDSKGTPSSKQDAAAAAAVAAEKSSAGNNSTGSTSSTDNFKSQSQSQSTMSTVAERPQRGGGDSLSEVSCFPFLWK